VKDHPEIVSGLQALFNQDNGTGRIENMSASGFPEASASLARYLARVPADITRNIKFGFPGNPSGGGRITRPSSRAARQALAWARATGLRPLHMAHQSRYLRQNQLDDVKNNAALAAMLVYLASEDTVRMSRERRTVFALTPGGQPGTWPECRDAQRTTPPLVRHPRPLRLPPPRDPETRSPTCSTWIGGSNDYG